MVNLLRKRVLLAMSGGIDSSFAAKLLLDSTYDLEGVFLHLCPQSRCCSAEAEARARLYAARLNIPFHRLDLEDLFRKRVIEHFLSEYRRGRTPNPCTLCNAEIKFGFLLDYALSQGFQFLATGHYAQVKFSPTRGSFLLLESRDQGKDQSYMLYRLNQHILPHVLFPLGDWTKEEIRARMEKVSLWRSTKESQDLCFLPQGTSLRQYMNEAGILDMPGPILDRSNKLLGYHQGLKSFTVGQRKGLRLAGGPFYVLELRVQDNALIVGSKVEAMRDSFLLEDMHWVAFPPEESVFLAQVRIRYRHPKAWARIQLFSADRAEVRFQEPQFAVTPGQAAVIYQGEEVLGGGTITID